MTPRALLATIGATAIAFAVAIGVAAGNSAVVNSSESSPIVFAAPAELNRVTTYEWSGGTSAASDWPPGTTCVISM